MNTNANINPLSKKNLFDNITSSQIAEEHFQLSLIINNSEEFLLLINRDYEVIMCNQFVQKSVKERINIDLNPGDDFFCMVSPEERERIKAFCARAFEGEKVEFEYKLSLEGNNTLYFQCIFKPAINHKGEITAVVVIFKEITEKKKAYDAVLQSEQRWRFALEGSNQGVWDWKLDTNEVYFSSSWRKMLGYDKNGLINNISEWEDLIHPDDKKRMAAHIEKHLHSHNSHYETELRLRAVDGSYKWILARGMIFKRSKDGRPSRLIGTHTDISERKKTEENYKLLFYNNPMPMWTYDRKTLQFLDVNNAAINHYGYSREEFLQMTILDIRPQEEREKVIKSTTKNISATDQNIWRHTKKNGEIITVNLVIQIFEDDSHEHCLVIAEDITEKIKAELNLKASENQYRTLFRSNPIPSFIYDTETLRFLEVNDAAIKHFGYSYKEFLQITLFDIHLPAHHDLLKKSFGKNQAITSLSNWKQINKAGETLIGDISVSSMLYNGINARRVVIKDITERVKQEQEALENISERKYQEELQSLELRVFEVSAVPAIHFHTVLKTLINGYENLHPGIQVSICLLGLTNEMEILAPGLDKEHCRQLRYFIEKQKSKLPFQQEFENNIIISSVDSDDWKNGMDAASFYNWKTSWSIPVYHHGGELLAFITVFLNQSRGPSQLEQNTLSRMRNLLRILMINHLSLEQIRISNERYDNMLKATHDLVWDWNLETGNFYRNKEGLRKVYGIHDEKSIQNVYSWMERIHPGDHIKVQRVINNILHATDQDTFDVEYRFKREDGDYAFIYDRGVIVRNKEGKPLRMIGAAQNVTDRKKLEQELLEQELDKQKFISQATIDTQEQERREIGKELHDNVNQVLTTTKLYLDLSLSSPDLKDELIKKSSKNIIYVINEIRQLSRSLMDPSIGDLGLVDSINDLIENINITRKLHVSLSASSDIEQYLDESQKLMIFRVIQEAMNNIIKYAQATSVQLSIKKIDENLELLIADDGKGFNIATVKKGSGLKNIQNRVYLTGGKLLIESEQDRGCKIVINFPINNKNKI